MLLMPNENLRAYLVSYWIILDWVKMNNIRTYNFRKPEYRSSSSPWLAWCCVCDTYFIECFRYSKTKSRKVPWIRNTNVHLLLSPWGSIPNKRTANQTALFFSNSNLAHLSTKISKRKIADFVHRILILKRSGSYLTVISSNCK